jgi:hypothetical protein
MQDSEFKIEKGVELVELPYEFGKGRPRIYPFAEMEVGDSIKVECPPHKIKYVRNRMIVAANCHSKYHNLNRKYSSRKVKGGCRLWRVA